MEYGAAPLYAAVVPPADDLTFMDEDGADRDAPLGQPGLRSSATAAFRNSSIAAPRQQLPARECRQSPGSAPTSYAA